MFFDNLTDLPKIASKTSCTIFVVPPDTKLETPTKPAKSSAKTKPTKTTKTQPATSDANLPTLKNTLYLYPDESKATRVISVEQIREFLALTNSRETKDRFFVITPADAMNEAAQNAFLKTFEEPKDFCHFVLLTEQPGALLPTILSRAQIFFPRLENTLDTPPKVNAKTPPLKPKSSTRRKNSSLPPRATFPLLPPTSPKPKRNPANKPSTSSLPPSNFSISPISKPATPSFSQNSPPSSNSTTPSKKAVTSNSTSSPISANPRKFIKPSANRRLML